MGIFEDIGRGGNLYQVSSDITNRAINIRDLQERRAREQEENTLKRAVTQAQLDKFGVETRRSEAELKKFEEEEAFANEVLPLDSVLNTGFDGLPETQKYVMGKLQEKGYVDELGENIYGIKRKHLNAAMEDLRGNKTMQAELLQTSITEMSAMKTQLNTALQEEKNEKKRAEIQAQVGQLDSALKGKMTALSTITSEDADTITSNVIPDKNSSTGWSYASKSGRPIADAPAPSSVKEGENKTLEGLKKKQSAVISEINAVSKKYGEDSMINLDILLESKEGATREIETKKSNVFEKVTEPKDRKRLTSLYKKLETITDKITFGIEEKAEIELPARIKTTSEALKWLQEVQGMTEEEAAQWLKENE